MRLELEIWNTVPYAVESDCTVQLPPPEVLPSSVTFCEDFSALGTRLPQEKLTGEMRQ